MSMKCNLLLQEWILIKNIYFLNGHLLSHSVNAVLLSVINKLKNTKLRLTCLLIGIFKILDIKTFVHIISIFNIG